MAPTFNWSRWTGFMALLIPALITTFNFAIFYRVIPAQVTVTYVVLSAASPNIVSLYLSNFAHVSFSHLGQNVVAYIAAVAAIAMIALVGIPRSGLQYTLDTKVLLQSCAAFLLVVPFIVSGASLLVAPCIGMEKMVGFSGVVFAFFGYVIFLLESLLLRKVQASPGKKEVFFGYTLMVMIVVIPVLVMNPVIHSNYAGHFVGFLCGIIVPAGFQKFPI